MYWFPTSFISMYVLTFQYIDKWMLKFTHTSPGKSRGQEMWNLQPCQKWKAAEIIKIPGLKIQRSPGYILLNPGCSSWIKQNVKCTHFAVGVSRNLYNISNTIHSSFVWIIICISRLHCYNMHIYLPCNFS